METPHATDIEASRLKTKFSAKGDCMAWQRPELRLTYLLGLIRCRERDGLDELLVVRGWKLPFGGLIDRGG